MATQIFINLPVKDLAKSTEFYKALGFTLNPMFSDKNASSLVVSESIYLMILVEEFFKTFTKKEIADATKTTEAILCLGLGSRAEVDAMVEKALASGGRASNDMDDKGFMYLRSFQDPDGHLWEVSFIDMSAMPPSP